MTWPSHDLTPQQTSRHQNTSLQSTKHHHHGTAEGSFTAKKWFGHRAGRSPCAHSIGKFFLCYIVLFPLETPAPGLSGHYWYIYIYISTIPQLFLQLTSTSSDISPMSSNPEAPRSLAEIGIAYEYTTWPPPKGGRQHVAQGEPWSGGRWAPKMILINGVKWVISPYKWPEINLWLIDNWDETKTWHLIP